MAEDMTDGIDAEYVDPRANQINIALNETLDKLVKELVYHLCDGMSALIDGTEDSEASVAITSVIICAIEYIREYSTIKTRRHRIKTYFDPLLNIRRPTHPRMSPWWIEYVENPDLEYDKWHHLFRRRFRLPYDSFQSLLLVVETDPNGYFDRWCAGSESEKKRTKTSPIELLLLGSLRYLGRGLTFDDISECTGINEEVQWSFFHKFIAFGAEVLFPKHVTLPETLQELEKCEHPYRIAGFPGCIGSSDATHIRLERVAAGIRQEHCGWKLVETARTFNVTVDHSRQILSSTTGHPARWSDATLARLDPMFDRLNSGDFNNFSFELDRRDDEPISINGAYVLVDNGYVNWSTIIPPMKNPTKISEAIYSKWLESLRKDVECTFGILKCRWRILKTGIRVHNTLAADNIFLTCCALHNILLHVDGLDEGWERGVPSFWEDGDNGEINMEDLPPSIQTLHQLASGVESIDDAIHGYVYGNEGTNRRHQPDPDDENEPVFQLHRGVEVGLVFGGDGSENDGLVINRMKMTEFRDMLIEHFTLQYHKRTIIWPRRLKNYTPVFHH